MGKYLKKSKPKSSAAELSLPPSSSSHPLTSGGVCTRAKTLALQRLRHPHPHPPPPQVSDPDPDLSYLQLRNRRLHKTIVSSKGKERERKAFPEDDPEKDGIYSGDCVSASFGENDPPEFDARDRESTPCSSIGGSIAIPMPGSMTRRRTSISSQRIRNDMFRGISTTHEIEDFFSAAEEEQRKSFIKKYNFDILNDMPLAGRYEWLEVMP